MSLSAKNVKIVLKAWFQSARKKASPALLAGVKTSKNYSLPLG